ncbi:histidine kinase [Halobacteriales archaeon QH_10_67_13]|nr:MAG: histidine kinase [Halobacteriales archaeon QH_10_67_13]
MSVSLQTTVVAVAYVAGFALTGLIATAAAVRASRIDDGEVRTGLVWLLATTGVWSLLQALFFVAPDPLREPIYTLGLVLGFAAVGAWLYFASAYTNRSYHRNPSVRRVGVALFLVVTAAKITNPIHRLYFTVGEEMTPFTHMAIELGPLHWIVTGISYSLAATAVFALFDMYVRAGYDVRPLGLLTAVVGLPAGLDVLSATVPGIVSVSYAPIGVAAFAVTALYVYEQRFLAAPKTDGEAVVFLDGDGQVRDYTVPAERLFPGIASARGTALVDVLPRVAAATDDDEPIVERRVDGEDRYYLVSETSVQLGESGGRALVFSDVTSTERRRRELSRHNEQLEELASALAHEFRNLIQIIDWRLAMAADRTDSGTVASDSIDAATEANERIADRVDDFTTLAQYGQTVDRLESVELREAVTDAWWIADTGEVELEIADDATLEADPGRLRELLLNAFVFACRNDAGTVKSGMKLPNARAFARVHGWSVRIDSDYQEGVRLVVSGVRIRSENSPRLHGG